MIFAWIFSLVVFFLPGLAWLFALRPTTRHVAEKIGIILGLSAAAYVLAFYLTFLVKVPLTPVLAWITWGLLGGVTLWFLGQRVLAPHPSSVVKGPIPWRKTGLALLPFLIFCGILALRFYQVRALVLPAWVDSLHHVLIVRIFLERGLVPQDFQPFFDAPFYYHFGFHAITAVAAYLSRLSPEHAVLYFGQVLNALAPFVLYLLARALWQDEKRALIVLVLVGFVFQMPAYYASWGRYTLLTGSIFLALAMSAALEIYQAGVSREKVARLMLYTLATLLTHYLAGLLLALFYIVLAGSTFFGSSCDLVEALKPRRLPALLAAGLGGGVLAAPWLWRVFSFSSGYVKLKVTLTSDAIAQAYSSDYFQYLWFLLGPRRSHLVLLVAIVALLLLGWKRTTLPFTLWTLLALLLNLPWGVNLSPFRPDHGAILAFFPASLFAADLVARGTEIPRPGWLRKTGQILAILCIAFLTIWGIKETRNIINPATIIATQADLDAIEWIKTNIPARSKFFINVTPWQYSTYRGVDGGWWISVLTENETFLPVALYTAGPRDTVTQINTLARTASSFSGCTPEFITFINLNDLNYIYVNDEQNGNIKAISLSKCSGFFPVYSNAQVSIFLYNR